MDHDIEKRSLLQMGSVCAWIAGMCYIPVVLFAFLSPTSIASYIASNQYFVDFTNYQKYFILLKIFMVLSNAAMIGVVAGVYQLKNFKQQGILTLFSLLAILGLGIGMLQSILDATQVPHLAAEYDASSPAIQHVIIAFGVANPALYILSLGLPGIWFMVISLVHLKTFPKFLIFLGFAWCLGSLMTVIAHLFVIIWLIYLVAAGALIAAPFWSIWQARYLWKQAQELK